MKNNSDLNAVQITNKAKLWITLSYVLCIVNYFYLIFIRTSTLINRGDYHNSVFDICLNTFNALVSLAAAPTLFIGVYWLGKLNYAGVRNAVIKFKISIIIIFCNFILLSNIGALIMTYCYGYLNIFSIVQTIIIFISYYLLISAIIELRQNCSSIAAIYIKRILICTIISALIWNLNIGYGISSTIFLMTRYLIYIILYILLIINWRKLLSLSDKAFTDTNFQKLSFKPCRIEWIYIGYILFITLTQIVTSYRN